MENNWNLSEKIRSELYGEYNSVIDDTEFHPEDSLKVKDVKEFIKLLKEKGKCKNPSQNGEIIYLLSEKEIDELAGERLK